MEGNKKCDAGAPEAPGAAAGLPELKSHISAVKDDMALKKHKVLKKKFEWKTVVG